MKNNEEKNLKLLFVLFYVLYLLAYTHPPFSFKNTNYQASVSKLGKRGITGIVFLMAIIWNTFVVYENLVPNDKNLKK
jgi:hypothetical protein